MTNDSNFENNKNIIPPEKRLPLLKSLPLSFQHLFAMFGGTVLVPILLNIDPATVLFMNGLGTLFYIFLTKGKIPAYLGSSFAFIAPVLYNINVYDYESALGGFIFSGFVFCIVALIVQKTGTEWLNTLLPPSAIGAIVSIIGLELAPTAAKMAGYLSETINYKEVFLSTTTLLIVILGSVLFRGFFKAIPILIGLIVGYCIAISLGMVDLTRVYTSAWFSLPTFYTPKFNLSAIMIIAPAVFVVIAEHVGHLVVTAHLVEKDLVKDPGLHRSMLANGLSTLVSGFIGSVPTTTYAENIGVMAITRVYSVWVIGGAAVISMILSLSGKLASIINTIPTPVIGAISLLLFGTIAVSGLRILIEQKVDYNKTRNLILTSIILVVGISGIQLDFYHVHFKGMALATMVGIILNLFFILFDKIKILNDNSD